MYKVLLARLLPAILVTAFDDVGVVPAGGDTGFDGEILVFAVVVLLAVFIAPLVGAGVEMVVVGLVVIGLVVIGIVVVEEEAK